MMESLFEYSVSMTRLRSQQLIRAIKAHLVDGISNASASTQYGVDKSSISRASARIVSIAKRITRRTIDDLVSLFAWRNRALKEAVQRRLFLNMSSWSGVLEEGGSGSTVSRPSLSRAYTKTKALIDSIHASQPSIGGTSGYQ